jgi:hypothetical protein
MGVVGFCGVWWGQSLVYGVVFFWGWLSFLSGVLLVGMMKVDGCDWRNMSGQLWQPWYYGDMAVLSLIRFS